MHVYYTTSLDPQVKELMKDVTSFFIVGHGPRGTTVMTNIAAENLGVIEMVFEREMAARGFKRTKIDVGSAEVAQAVVGAIKSEMNNG